MLHKDTLYSESFKPFKIGFLIIIATFILIFIWGGLAPLDSAVIAPGSVKLSHNHKEIQHYEGGIIQEIYVKDGDEVSENTPLLKLNSSAAQSNMYSKLTILRARTAAEKRIIAQINNLQTVEFDSQYLHPVNDEIIPIIDSQRNVFKARTAEFHNKISSYEQEKMRLMQKISGLKEQLKATEESQKIKDELLKDTVDLYNKRVLSKHNMISVRKEHINGLKNILSIKSDIEIAQHDIKQNQISSNSYSMKYYSDLASEYERNHIEYLDALQKYNNALDIYERTTIKSSSPGIVTALKHHTINGIIRPGEIIMLIIPQNDKMIIESMISPKDINDIRVGMSAKIQFDSYKRRTTPRALGKVIYVSADKIKNNDRAPDSYLVRIEIDKNSLHKAINSLTLQPGLPVTVFLVRGKRTVLSYIISPIIESFRMAFKEQ